MDVNGPPLTVAIVEVLGRDGRTRQTIRVTTWPVTIGRAVDCTVVLEDVHVAPRHATLTEAGGSVTLEVGETVNGVRLQRHVIASRQRMPVQPGETLEIGRTRLRVRRLTDPIPAELPLVFDRPRGRWPVVALGVALGLWILFDEWLDNDPGRRLVDYVPGPLIAASLVALWSFGWSAASRLVTHRFDFWTHAHIALRYAVGVLLMTALLPLAAFATGWTVLSRVSGIAFAIAVGGAVAAHLSRLLPLQRRIVAAAIAGLIAIGVTLTLVRQYQAYDRVFPELYVSTIGPPALRVAPTVTPRQFIDEARSLKAILDAHARDDEPAAR